VPPWSLVAARRDHLIVSGEDALASRVVEELTTRYGQDDLGNFHAALRAQELSPGLRLVVRIFNTRLGEWMNTFFTDCAVLSGSSMAAPSFVAAALGEPAPSHVRVAGRTPYVVRSSAIDPRHVICGLAMTDDPLSPALLPPTPGTPTWCSRWRTVRRVTRSPGSAGGRSPSCR
jgi:hypothetical protein